MKEESDLNFQNYGKYSFLNIDKENYKIIVTEENS